MLHLLAEHCAERGMADPARLCVRLALRLPGSTAEGLTRLLEVTRRIDDRRLAVKVAERLVALEPRDPALRGVLATLQLLLGEIDAAEAEAGRARALLAPEDPAPRVVRDALLDPDRAHRGEAYVTWVDDVLVETAFWSIVKDDRVFNMEVHGRSLVASPFIEGRVAPDETAFLMRCLPPAVHVEEPCVFLGGDENYSHWVNRNLLKLALVEEHAEFARLPLLINDDLRPYQREYLDMLGIDAARLIRVPRNTVVACRRVAVPTLLRNHPKMRLGTDWIRRRLARHMAAGEPQGLLFVSRRDAVRRVIVNEQELAEALEAQGFRTIVPSELTAREQIEAFSASRVIVAAHGAALANLVFAPAGAFVIELASAAILHMSTFRQLTGVLGQRLVTLVSDDYDVTRPEQNASHLDYRVDVAEVLAVLRREESGIFTRAPAAGAASESAATVHS
jgi:capsular polysaccharide biosynthesis protein